MTTLRLDINCRQKDSVRQFLGSFQPQMELGSKLSTSNRPFVRGAQNCGPLKSAPGSWRQIPGAAAGVENFIIELDESKVLPEAFGIIRASRHQVGL